MDNEEKIKPDSRTMFPHMMQTTRLLILDHDVFRYHSFELFRYILRQPGMLKECDPKILSLVLNQQTLSDQIYRYERGCPNLNPYDCFPKYRGTMHTQEYEKRLVANLPNLKVIPTDIARKFNVIFDRHTITGHVLRYNDDQFELPFDDAIRTHRSDNILNLNAALELIMTNRINAVMVCSSDLAVILAAKLTQRGITWPMSFIIGSYGYNMGQDGQLRLVAQMFAYEQHYKHEFGMYEPFTGLMLQHKEEMVHERTTDSVQRDSGRVSENLQDESDTGDS